MVVVVIIVSVNMCFIIIVELFWFGRGLVCCDECVQCGGVCVGDVVVCVGFYCVVQVVVCIQCEMDVDCIYVVLWVLQEIECFDVVVVCEMLCFGYVVLDVLVQQVDCDVFWVVGECL